MYAIIENSQVVEYPIVNIYQRFPDVSFPSPLVPSALPEGVVEVPVAKAPIYDTTTHKAVMRPQPVLAGGSWVLEYAIEPLSDLEKAQYLEAVQRSIVQATQRRLDDFAKTRNYEGILSACTYATSPTGKFRQEGQQCVALRDATWAVLYSILNDVQRGVRQAPTSFADIEPELPALTWAD